MQMYMWLHPFNPKYLEWYSPCLDLEHTIQVCRGESVNYVVVNIYTINIMSYKNNMGKYGSLMFCLNSTIATLYICK